MQDLLRRIASGLEQGHYTNERAVSTSIVVPILRALNWDDADPTLVRPEYTSGQGRVDYALFPKPGSPAVFVEVKGVGKSGEADLQLFQYAFHEGAQIAVLTDGRVWNFYLPGEHGNYDERRVYQLDILERQPAESQERFTRYLERGRVVQGDALRDARADYQNRASQRQAEAVMPKAWQEMLVEPDVELMNLLRERAEAMSGHRPSEAALEAFLRSRIGPASDASAFGRAARTRGSNATAVKVVATVSKPTAATPELVSVNRPGGKAKWRVCERNGEERDQASAFVALLSELFRRFPDRQEQMAAAVRTRSRNNIARRVEDVYPGKPQLAAKANRPLVDGWYVGTNESSATKMRIAMGAARASGLNWGQDVDLEM